MNSNDKIKQVKAIIKNSQEEEIVIELYRVIDPPTCPACKKSPLFGQVDLKTGDISLKDACLICRQPIRYKAVDKKGKKGNHSKHGLHRRAIYGRSPLKDDEDDEGVHVA